MEVTNSFDYLSKTKVVLGISGGVDSTAAALLLLEKGFELYGMYFDITGTEKGKVEAEKALFEAYKRANINYDRDKHFIYIDAKESFNDIVIRNFCNEYKNGRTPNPCIICNPNVKFKYLIDVANKVGAFYIATGHYASTYFNEATSNWHIKKSLSPKDQSYMLCRLGQDVISRLIFPLEHIISKDETREIAKQANFFNADLKDSQEICFIEKDASYIDFLKNKVESIPGNFIDIDGNILGKHTGIINYTVGQRKGLGITFGKPMFVVSINAENNTVMLGSNDDLFVDKVVAKDVMFTGFGSEMPTNLKGRVLKVKLRYAAKPANAFVLQQEDGSILALFEEKQRAATSGQSMVIYDEDIVVGCGFII